MEAMQHLVLGFEHPVICRGGTNLGEVINGLTTVERVTQTISGSH